MKNDYGYGVLLGVIGAAVVILLLTEFALFSRVVRLEESQIQPAATIAPTSIPVPTPRPEIVFLERERPIIPELVVMVDATGRMCIGRNMHKLHAGMAYYYSLMYCVQGGAR